MTQEELLFFSGHPEALALYTLLKEGLLRRYADTLFLPAKTQISLKNAFVFGAASLPRSKKPERSDADAGASLPAGFTAGTAYLPALSRPMDASYFSEIPGRSRR